MGEGYRGRLACAGAGRVHGSGNVRVCRHGEGRGTKGSDTEGSDDDQNADERCFVCGVRLKRVPCRFRLGGLVLSLPVRIHARSPLGAQCLPTPSRLHSAPD
eukprot:scaffold34543_cov63-Phaeocystis_antarctica.AAC.2